MVRQVVSLVEAGALAHLEELRIRRHRALQPVFRPFFLSLVHCPRLRLVGLGDSDQRGSTTYYYEYIREVRGLVAAIVPRMVNGSPAMRLWCRHACMELPRGHFV